MSILDKSVIRVAQILEIDVKKAEKFFDAISLSDMAGLTTAVAHNDDKTVKEIYDTYASQLVDLPSPDAIADYYEDQFELTSDSEAALANTADFFGVKEEDVTSALGDVVAKPVNSAIHDEKVVEAVKCVQTMIEGKPARKIISELNVWQRRMMYGLIPDSVAKIIKGVLDTTPLGLIKKQAELQGVAEISVTESQMSFQDMIENILSHVLKGFTEEVMQTQEELQVELTESKLTDAQSKLIKSITTKRF